MDAVSRKFWDRHRCQLGFDIVEQPGQLLVRPKAHSMGCVVAWVLIVYLAIIGIAFHFQIWKDLPFPFPLFLAGLTLVCLVSAGILFAIYQAEVTKGPVLEVDRKLGVLALPRDQRKIKCDDVEAISLLIGWYEWTDWQQVAEMTLIVRRENDRIEAIPVILHNEVGSVEELAERVAEVIGKPVRRTQLTWEERQAGSGHGG